MDYEAQSTKRNGNTRLIFKQEGEKVLASGEFGEFFNANKEWLQPYAVFSYLRDAFQTPNFREWPRHSVYNAQDIEKMCRPESVDYAYRTLLLYPVSPAPAIGSRYEIRPRTRCRTQRRYPYRHQPQQCGSMDRTLLLQSQRAGGRPSDDFSVNGQNWGFPTYNWDVMERTATAGG